MRGSTVPVAPGIDMSDALMGRRLTKAFLRGYLRENPQKDFRILVSGMGTYVNGEDAIRHDLTLEVRQPRGGDFVALVNFQSTDDNEWGYQAVVA
jgi:hypothetical protein